MASSDLLSECRFLSSKEGWIQTSSGLYWTDDGSRTWKRVPLPLTYSRAQGRQPGLINDVYFATPQTGWALGSREVSGDPAKEPIRYRIAGENSVYVPALFRTNDHGRTWTRQSYPDLKLVPYRLEFADSEHGLSIELNRILYTRNGGGSWMKSRYCADVNTKKLHSAELGSDTFTATTAHLLDAEYGWWSVEGDLLRTSDGGETWCQLPSILRGGKVVAIAQVRFATRELGWAVPTVRGRQQHPTPPFETVDGGKSWRAIDKPRNLQVDECTVLPDALVYFWGDGGLYLLERK
jgi:photosystem II stability/assembly factor-like uncharacterized protein